MLQAVHGMAAHIFNPGIQEAESGNLHGELQASQGCTLRPCLRKKKLNKCHRHARLSHGKAWST